MDVTITRIVQLIKKANLPEAAFGEALGMGKNTVNNWKAGRSKTYLKKIDSIADYFGVSVDYLLGRTDDPHPAISNDDVKNAIDEYVKSKGKQSTVIRYNGKEQTYETLDMTDEEWEIAQATIEALRLKRK
jgi:phage transcriptional regulator|nr:MAG TPA: repressor protein [Caudoviricetes sp.]